MNPEAFMKRLLVVAVVVIVCMQFNVSSNTTEVNKVPEEHSSLSMHHTSIIQVNMTIVLSMLTATKIIMIMW